MNLILSGCNGRMGRAITALCSEEADITIVAGVDARPEKLSSFPVYADVREFTGKADCIVDFSSPAALDSLLEYALRQKTPLVLAATGYSDEQLAAIRDAAQELPVFRSANMSLGVNVLLELVKTAARVLGEAYDIEIVEHHHNQKLDAPSGTALMIAEAAASVRQTPSEFVYDRHDVRQKRGPSEIGISSVRGGTIVGIHETYFAGHDEILEIKHTAMSREIFAAGAVKAAQFLSQQTAPGLYSMSDVVANMM